MEHHPEDGSISEAGTNPFQALFELSPTPAAVFSTDGRCRLANRAFYHQLGYAAENIEAGEPRFHALFEQPAYADELIAEITERSVVRRRDLTIVDQEGHRIPMLFSGRTLTFDGEPCFDAAFTDISHQKRLEKAFRRDHARMDSLIESLTAGLFLIDMEGNITGLNMALANLCGFERDALIGEPYQRLYAYLLKDAREPEVVQQSLAHATLTLSERPTIEITRSAESAAHLELTFFPVRDENGAPLGWGGLVQDVTEVRDRLSWKLELLSILAHDIRTPLATLKGHATAILANYQRWGEGMVLEFLEAMDRTTDELVRQVDRSLALTRVETGRMGLRPEAVDPEHLVHHAIERAAGVLGDMPVEVEAAPAAPMVRADPARVEEVLVNLLENAVRFHPVDTPLIVRLHQDGPMLQYSVIDRGPGVAPENQRRIFEKYARARSEGGGVGLGLFIARKIVEAHGGKIWVESPPPNADRGAQFTFTVPVMPAPTERKIPEEPLFPDRQLQTPADQRLLIAEDDPQTQELLHAILSQEGYQVEWALDGPAAIKAFQASSPNLVILDWVLPGMSGVQVCRAIRRWSDVPILMLTSRTAQEDLVTALDSGADDYVTKPFQTPELLARIHALVRRGEPRAVPQESERLQFEDLLIDLEARAAWLSGTRLALTPTEFELLYYLAKRPARVLTHDQLVDHLWGPASSRTRHDLFVHVSRLRKKMEPDPKNPRFIVTRWGIGYVFMPEG